MKNFLTGNIKFINVNDNNIEMYINEEKQSTFTNTIQFENDKNYKIKLIFPNNLISCKNMFRNIHDIIN